MQFIFYSKEQRQKHWKLFLPLSFSPVKSKMKPQLVGTSMNEWSKTLNFFFFFVLEALEQLILFSLNPKSDYMIIIELLTEFNFDAFPYTFTVKTSSLFNLDHFQHVSIYSNIILLSKSWLSILFCKLSISSSWPNFFWFCCHFCMATSNSLLLYSATKSKIFYSLRIVARSEP